MTQKYANNHEFGRKLGHGQGRQLLASKPCFATSDAVILPTTKCLCFRDIKSEIMKSRITLVITQ